MLVNVVLDHPIRFFARATTTAAVGTQAGCLPDASNRPEGVNSARAGLLDRADTPILVILPTSCIAPMLRYLLAPCAIGSYFRYV